MTAERRESVEEIKYKMRHIVLFFITTQEEHEDIKHCVHYIKSGHVTLPVLIRELLPWFTYFFSLSGQMWFR